MSVNSSEDRKLSKAKKLLESEEKSLKEVIEVAKKQLEHLQVEHIELQARAREENKNRANLREKSQRNQENDDPSMDIIDVNAILDQVEHYEMQAREGQNQIMHLDQSLTEPQEEDTSNVSHMDIIDPDAILDQLMKGDFAIEESD